MNGNNSRVNQIMWQLVKKSSLVQISGIGDCFLGEMLKIAGVTQQSISLKKSLT